MNNMTEKLVSQHRQYVKDNPKELEKYATLYEHMLFYFTAIRGIDEQTALQYIHDLKTDLSCDIVTAIVSSEIL
ncbi:hypothetical protein [Paenibacillus alba]|uniref:Uncharacterized protein n=1 Tax=Paenibacillus alba TaxID=1197127 RepID=A0ABU6G538_9BACL|nr:hypothetical protein [Paenibacillus alba]MEC0229292.1 hypothetical protein [Paenibacillus alba]NQX65696.1 hypothetical protein [Paenibacillus alba]